MLPLGDASRRQRYFPIVTILIIVLNFAMFALELGGGDDFILRWSLVPADIVAGRHLETILSSMFDDGGARAAGPCTMAAVSVTCGPRRAPNA